LIQIGTETIQCQNEYDANNLLEKVSRAIDQGKEYEQEKMKYITTLAIEIFGWLRGNHRMIFLLFCLFSGPDEGHHRIKHVTARNIELINAFIKVHQDISVVQRNFQHRNDYFVTKQLPVFVKPMKDTTINGGTR